MFILDLSPWELVLSWQLIRQSAALATSGFSSYTSGGFLAAQLAGFPTHFYRLLYFSLVKVLLLRFYGMHMYTATWRLTLLHWKTQCNRYYLSYFNLHVVIKPYISDPYPKYVTKESINLVILSHRTVCPSRCFVHLTFCPTSVLSTGQFVPLYVLFNHMMIDHKMFHNRMFCNVGRLVTCRFLLSRYLPTLCM